MGLHENRSGGTMRDDFSLSGRVAGDDRETRIEVLENLIRDGEIPVHDERLLQREADVVARDYFGQAIMGTVLGAAAMVSSLGMAIGPWIGGWLYDTFGSYAPLYMYSFAIGIGATAIAFAFPPPMARAGSALAAAST